MKKQSAWPWLGLYVVRKYQRQRGADAGTWLIHFHVPARLRPADWAATIDLPKAKPYCKGPDDLECIVRIKEEAAALYAALRDGRSMVDEQKPMVRIGSVPWLIEKWGGRRLLEAVDGRMSTTEAALHPDPKAREEWLNCAPRTRQLYIRTLRSVMAWSISIRHVPVSMMTPMRLRDYLNLFKPGQRKNIRDVLSQLFGIAGEEGLLETNPLNGRKASVKRKLNKRHKGGRKTKVERWRRDDVDLYCTVAMTQTAWQNATGKRTKVTWRGGSVLIRLMYETAADSTDVMTWEKATHLVEREGYRGIDFDRGKTGQPTFIPLSDQLLREIDEYGTFFLVTDPFGAPYEAVKDDARMRGHMITLQEQVVKAGGPRRIYDHLRHSAATEAEEMGVELDKVRHLTAHKDSKMNREVYVQTSAKITVEIQQKRGLIRATERVERGTNE